MILVERGKVYPLPRTPLSSLWLRPRTAAIPLHRPPADLHRWSDARRARSDPLSAPPSLSGRHDAHRVHADEFPGALVRPDSPAVQTPVDLSRRPGAGVFMASRDHPPRRFRKRPGHFPTHDTDLARASSALGGVDSTCLRCRRAALRVRRSPSGDRHDHRSASGANDPAPPGPRGRRSHLHPFTGPAPSRIRLAHSPRRPQRKHSRSATSLPAPAPDHG